MEERLHMLTQQSIDAMNENENDEKYKVASAGISKRKVKFWERWTGWYTLLVADLVADVALEVAKGRGTVAVLIAMFVAFAVFVAAGFWYCRWFDKVLEKTYVVNLIEKEKADDNGNGIPDDEENSADYFEVSKPNGAKK